MRPGHHRALQLHHQRPHHQLHQRRPIPANGGVYRYSGGFPTQTWSASTYWVDIVFTKS